MRNWEKVTLTGLMHRSATAQLRQKNTFTLIELLVVIAIISILMSILLPALKQAKAMGYRIKCLSSLKQLGSSCEMYSNDYGDYWPTSQHCINYPNFGIMATDVAAVAGPAFPPNLQLYNGSALLISGYTKFTDLWCPSHTYRITTGNYDLTWCQNTWNTWVTSGYSTDSNLYLYIGYTFRCVGSKSTIRYLSPSRDSGLPTKPIIWDDVSGCMQGPGGTMTRWSHEDGYNVLYGDCSARWVRDLHWGEMMKWDSGTLYYYGTQATNFITNFLDNSDKTAR